MGHVNGWETYLTTRTDMFQRLLLTPLLLLPLLSADKVKEDARDDDAKKMQGNWAMTAMEQNGKEAPLPPRGQTDPQNRSRQDGSPDDKPGTFKLGTDKKLKTIDFIGLDGKTIKGIYELDGDTLRICLSMPSSTDRPTDLSSKGDRMLVKLKRKK